jgi:hypothetical protein
MFNTVWSDAEAWGFSLLTFRYHFNCELKKGLFHLETISRTNVEVQHIAIRSLEVFDLGMRDLFLVEILFIA